MHSPFWSLKLVKMVTEKPAICNSPNMQYDAADMILPQVVTWLSRRELCEWQEKRRGIKLRRKENENWKRKQWIGHFDSSKSIILAYRLIGLLFLE